MKERSLETCRDTVHLWMMYFWAEWMKHSFSEHTDHHTTQHTAQFSSQKFHHRSIYNLTQVHFHTNLYILQMNNDPCTSTIFIQLKIGLSIEIRTQNCSYLKKIRLNESCLPKTSRTLKGNQNLCVPDPPCETLLTFLGGRQNICKHHVHSNVMDRLLVCLMQEMRQC